jgi:hypothetical protein
MTKEAAFVSAVVLGLGERIFVGHDTNSCHCPCAAAENPKNQREAEKPADGLHCPGHFDRLPNLDKPTFRNRSA